MDGRAVKLVQQRTRLFFNIALPFRSQLSPEK